MRQQVGALPVRWTGDEPRVLLVTSRETQRWIIPKGWRMRGRSNADAAAQEALEEAGVSGRVRAKPIGRYTYAKRLADGVEDCKITTYLLEVTNELETFPEMGERRREWFTVAEAAACADDEGLRDILREIEPRLSSLRTVDRKAARKRAKAAKGKAAGKKAAGVEASGGRSSGGKSSEGKSSGRKAAGNKSPARDEPPAEAVSDDAGFVAATQETSAAGPTSQQSIPEIAASETPSRKGRTGKTGTGKSGAGKSSALKSSAAKSSAGKTRVRKSAKVKAMRKAPALTAAPDEAEAAE